MEEPACSDAWTRLRLIAAVSKTKPPPHAAASGIAGNQAPAPDPRTTATTFSARLSAPRFRL